MRTIEGNGLTDQLAGGIELELAAKPDILHDVDSDAIRFAQNSSRPGTLFGERGCMKRRRPLPRSGIQRRPQILSGLTCAGSTRGITPQAGIDIDLGYAKITDTPDLVIVFEPETIT